MIDNEFLSSLPADSRPSMGEIEAAYRIFGEKKSGHRPHLRVLIGSWKRDTEEKIPDRNYPTLRIIIDNRLCLFFYGNSGEWKFDGYECGDYDGYWIEFDWLPAVAGSPTKEEEND